MVRLQPGDVPDGGLAEVGGAFGILEAVDAAVEPGLPNMSGDVFIKAQLQGIAAGGAVGAPMRFPHMDGSVSRPAKSLRQQIG